MPSTKVARSRRYRDAASEADEIAAPADATAPQQASEKIRILFADDHHLVREALAGYLMVAWPGAEVVEAATLADALQRLGEPSQFDVILLDFDMPGMNGLAGVERMQAACGRTPIVILSGNIPPQDAVAALDLGVGGIVTKDFKGRALLDAIGLVLDGERYFPPALVQRAIGAAADDKEQEDATRLRLGGLSEREYSVLKLLATGLSNKEIALRLGLAEGTIKVHLHHVFAKLGARNRADAVRLALERGLATMSAS